MPPQSRSLDRRCPDAALPEPGAKRHRQCLRWIQPMTHERQTALIAEARAARVREHGPQRAKSEREDRGKRQR